MNLFLGVHISQPVGLGQGSHALQQDDELEGLEEEEEAGLDWDLEPHQVVQRIETCALWLAQQVSAGQLPDFVLSAPTNSRPTQAVGATQQTPQPPPTRSLLGRHSESADRFARLWSVLDICHEVLVAGDSATQRELHYRLKVSEVFGSTSHLREAIQDAVLLLRVPRSSLGITCSSKGLVGGSLLLQNTVSGEIIDCSASAAPEGRPIPGNISAISELAFSSTAAAVLIIEKDTVFQQLTTNPAIGGSGQFILITGKGVPDVGTRAFAAAVHAAFPSLPLLGLVDWNPSGVVILNLYKYGSRRMAESVRYALPALQWLGVRSGMLQAADGEAFHSLTPRDRGLLPGLRAQLAETAPDWLQELDAMESSGSKADIEAVYSCCGGAAGLGELLQQHIAARDWI